ncbi:MAG TPA: hypothetical protein PLT03_01465 [Bacillota bacterium]|nr:hypothetical protein [Bacillota bacterium]HOG52521.1 hypothetical protein [Bacillota bacterium]
MGNRGGAVIMAFVGSLAVLALLVFAYTYFSGGGPLGRYYLSAYISLGALLLTVAASMAGRKDRRGS